MNDPKPIGNNTLFYAGVGVGLFFGLPACFLGLFLFSLIFTNPHNAPQFTAQIIAVLFSAGLIATFVYAAKKWPKFIFGLLIGILLSASLTYMLLVKLCHW